MTPENPPTDSHLDLGQYYLNLYHRPSDGADVWYANFTTTDDLAEKGELLVNSEADLAAAFLPWLGAIAALGSDYEQACFQVLHQIESLLPPTVIARILDHINQQNLLQSATYDH